MTADRLLTVAIIPALSILPRKMDTPAARAMLIAIALQESRCRQRRQLGGPAKSFWQFEVAGIRGLLSHAASKPYLADALDALAYPVTADATVPYVAIEHNDVLASVCARLLLWTLPTALPTQHDPDAGWAQYVAAWRPGKPRPETWAANFAVGWDAATSARAA